MRRSLLTLVCMGFLAAACGEKPLRCPEISCPSGLECVDGECVEIDDPCDDFDCNPNARCENRLGVAVCVCEEGFELDTETCPDVEECSVSEVFCYPACVVSGCEDGVCDTESGLCVECRNDNDCEGDLICVEGSCVMPPCTTSEECPEEGQECDAGVCVWPDCTPATCEALGVECGEHDDTCEGTVDCGGCPPGEGCDPDSFTCRFWCSDNDDCEGGLRCRPDNGNCVECLAHSHCRNITESDVFCHPETSTCVACLADVDCARSEVCRPDPVLGAGVCWQACRADSECPLTGICMDGACRLSFCSPNGEIGGTAVQRAAYGDSCSLFEERDRERYSGFCLGPMSYGGLFGGFCHRTGDINDHYECDEQVNQGNPDREICEGICFPHRWPADSECLPVCHPGDCINSYCMPGPAGLQGVCMPGWDGAPRPLGSACDGGSFIDILRDCGEGMVCIEHECQRACDLAGFIGCPGAGETCRPIVHEHSTNDTIGWCG